MKKRLASLFVLIALAITTPLVNTGCTTPASARVATYQSLKVVHDSADAAVALSAKLYASGVITAVQANQVRAFYDGTFQPAYRIAVIAAQGNLEAIAGADVTTLATQLVSLVQKLQSHSS